MGNGGGLGVGAESDVSVLTKITRGRQPLAWGDNRGSSTARRTEKAPAHGIVGAGHKSRGREEERL